MHPPIRTYKVRRRVTPSHAAALARLRPRYGAQLPAEGLLDTAALFGRRAPLVLEIGSGMGEATAAMAAQQPDHDLLVAEVHTPGVAALMVRLETGGLDHVRILERDGRDVLHQLAPASLREVRVFFPDPWPKLRHAKRRLVDRHLLELLAPRMSAGAVLHVATDDESYLAGVLGALDGSAFTAVHAERGGRATTGFEQRALDLGRPCHDVRAVRR